MSTTTAPEIESRILDQGYGPGAWHGPDLKAALGDVTPALAFRRPAGGRHNIAEIALHHAWYARSVWAQLSGETPEPFILPGEDWFAVEGEDAVSWAAIQATVDAAQQRLASLVADLEAGRRPSPIPNADRFTSVLGITCHAVYHAGQIQLVKRLVEG